MVHFESTQGFHLVNLDSIKENIILSLHKKKIWENAFLLSLVKADLFGGRVRGGGGEIWII